MGKIFKGGISTSSLVSVVIVFLAALGFVGYEGNRLAKDAPQVVPAARPAHSVELVVGSDTLEPKLAPEPGDEIDWVAGDGASAINFKFAGPSTFWPCPSAPCKLTPKHDGDTYIYSCTIGSGTSAPVCGDPELGPISLSNNLDHFLKQLDTNHINGLPLQKGSTLVRTQIYCNPDDKGPVGLFNLIDLNADEPVQMGKKDKIVWANATGGNPFTVTALHNFSCSESTDANANYAASGCTLSNYSGTVNDPATYTIQGCAKGSKAITEQITLGP